MRSSTARECPGTIARMQPSESRLLGKVLPVPNQNSDAQSIFVSQVPAGRSNCKSQGLDWKLKISASSRPRDMYTASNEFSDSYSELDRTEASPSPVSRRNFSSAL